MAYVELHALSHFSFLRSAAAPEQLVEQAAALGYQALALTDECSVAGVVRAHSRAKALGITLLIGSEFQLEEGSTLVLLAQDRAAYGQLCALITRGRCRAAKGKYSLNWEDLLTLGASLIWLWPVLNHAPEQWPTILQRLTPVRDQLWLIVERDLTPDNSRRYQHLSSFAAHHQLRLAAAGGVLMHQAQFQPLLDTLTAIRCGKPVHHLGYSKQCNAEHAMRSQEKLQTLFPPFMLNETLNIAAQCHFSLDELKYEYPHELVPDGQTANQYLRTLVAAGCQQRFPDGLPSALEETLEHELMLIGELRYEMFFLTIYDIVNYAKRQRILYQGRGSAANSIVCYCLGITAVDPQKVSVLFERFISRERGEPPDIDVDFEHQRREEIIQYIYRKYGRTRAALAAAVITYRWRSAVRDVGKALGLAETQLNPLIEQVDRHDATRHWSEHLAMIGINPDSHQGRWLVTLVEQLRGFPRHLSQHVGGFVIASGVTFVTLEDETGSINLVVWQATQRAQRRPFLTARLMEVQGIVESSDGVTHVIAGRLTDRSQWLAELAVHSRDFH